MFFARLSTNGVLALVTVALLISSGINLHDSFEIAHLNRSCGAAQIRAAH
ncbi:MAG: hypothetical protein WDM86_11090 [Rhizomicrobium sp.]